MEKERECKTFVKITNQDIFNKLNLLEKKLDGACNALETFKKDIDINRLLIFAAFSGIVILAGWLFLIAKG